MLEIALILLCFIFAPALGFIAINIHHAPLQQLLMPLYLSCAIALPFLLLLALGRVRTFKVLNQIAIGLSLIWYLQFYLANFYHLFEAISFSHRWAKVTAWILIISAATLIGYFSYKKIMLRVLLIYACLTVIANVITIGLNFDFRQLTVFSTVNERGDNQIITPTHTSPNVYYIIMDGFGSAPTISKNTGIDFSNFHKILEKRGFYIAHEARSSYNMTHLTLASIFNLDYFHEGNGKTTSPSSYLPSLINKNSLSDAPLVEKAKNTGYEVVYVGNSWFNCSSKEMHVKCLKDLGKTDATILSSIIDDYAFVTFAKGSGIEIIANKIQSVIDKNNKVSGEKFNNTNDAIMASMTFIKDNIETHKKSGNFYFIHNMIPHPPYVDSSCVKLENANYKDWDRRGYRTSVLCSVLRIIEFSDYLNKIDPGAIVVFQGDHGPAFTYNFEKQVSENTPEMLYERFAIFNAIKLPETCRSSLNSSIGNVETIQLVMDCISNGTSKYVLPKSKSFAGFYNNHIDYGKLFEVKNDVVLPTKFRH